MKVENSTATWERHLKLAGDSEELVYRSAGANVSPVSWNHWSSLTTTKRFYRKL